MFERFTERARQVVVLAQEEARTLKHNYIGTEHILLGLLCEEEGHAAQALKSLGITTEQVREQVDSREYDASGQIPFTPQAKKILELALREALRLDHNYIGTEHILLGLLYLCDAMEKDCFAQRLLKSLGIETDQIRIVVLQRLDADKQATAGKLGGLILQLGQSIDSLSSLVDKADISDPNTRAAILREILNLMHVKHDLQGKS